MKFKITNYTNDKLILKTREKGEEINIMLEKTEIYERDSIHNVHISTGKERITLYFQERYERISYSYIHIPNDKLIDIKIER